MMEGSLSSAVCCLFSLLYFVRVGCGCWHIFWLVYEYLRCMGEELTVLVLWKTRLFTFFFCRSLGGSCGQVPMLFLSVFFFCSTCRSSPCPPPLCKTQTKMRRSSIVTRHSNHLSGLDS